jgi:hypothetical protein
MFSSFNYAILSPAKSLEISYAVLFVQPLTQELWPNTRISFSALCAADWNQIYFFQVM